MKIKSLSTGLLGLPVKTFFVKGRNPDDLKIKFLDDPKAKIGDVVRLENDHCAITFLLTKEHFDYKISS